MEASSESEVIAQELSSIAARVSALETRLIEVEAVIERLEPAAETTARALERSRRIGTACIGRCAARSSSRHGRGHLLRRSYRWLCRLDRVRHYRPRSRHRVPSDRLEDSRPPGGSTRCASAVRLRLQTIDRLLCFGPAALRHCRPVGVRVVGAYRFEVVSTATWKVARGEGFPIKPVRHVPEPRQRGCTPIGGTAKRPRRPAQIEAPVPSRRVDAAAHASARGRLLFLNVRRCHFRLCDQLRRSSRSPTFSFNSLCARRSATASLS
jgi:hypothetical protein